MASVDVGDIIKNITDDVKTIVRGEVELLKAEIMPPTKDVGVGAGMFGGAGYTGLNAVSLLFMAGGFGFGALFTQLLNWPVLGAAALGFVIMAVILLIITGILAMIGKGKVNRAKDIKPEQTVNEAKATVDSVKTAAGRGTEEVNSGRALESYQAERNRELEAREPSFRTTPVKEKTASDGPSVMDRVRNLIPTGATPRNAAGKDYVEPGKDVPGTTGRQATMGTSVNTDATGTPETSPTSVDNGPGATSVDENR